jgi:putative transcription factor
VKEESERGYYKLRCEVCGRKIHSNPVRAIIEGARLTVCMECGKHGKVILPGEEKPAQKPVTSSMMGAKSKAPVALVQKKKPVARVEFTKELVSDYGNKIRIAREQMGLSHEDLGLKINEKASVLRHLETGKMEPNNTLASKLEHMLKIKLLVPIPEEQIQGTSTADREVTLGDLVDFDKDAEATKERKPS